MYPDTPLKDVYMFFDEIQLIEGWELFVLRVYKNYCKHILVTGSTAKMLSEEMASALNIFMFRKVEKYDRSMVKQRSAPAKYYVADIALRNAVLLPESEDAGKALENIVYLDLERSLGEEDRIFYFNDSKVCDFVVQRGDRISELIQVCWALDDDNIERDGVKIEVLPIWNMK